ncbi:MAG: AMIN domain-containing protein [Alphaproteobacteria bacterium]|nr:MAG: AMIN domain-containing protein [Alphaproteobacteria bacterium]
MLYKPITYYRLFIPAFLALICLFSNPAFAQEITNIRFGQPEPQVYRIVIETDRDVDFQFHIADEPHRLVVTIPAASLPDSGLPRIKTAPPFLPFADGNFSAEDGRLVFAFDGYLHVKAGFMLKGQGEGQANRIVIDLEKVSAALFAAAVNSRWHRDKVWGDRAERVIPAFRGAPASVVRQRDDISTAFSGDNDFLGPYIGFTVGYVRGKDKDNELLGGVASGWTTETDPNSALVSLVGGYNILQARNVVLGVEADFELRKGNDSAVYLFNGVPDPTYPVKASLRQAASLRARAGYLFNDRQSMAFVSGGIAAAKIDRTYIDTALPGALTLSEWQSGWVAGFGAEHRITPKISVVIEGRYADYGSKTLDTSSIWGAGYTEKQSYTEKSLRIGSVFRF